MKSISMYLSILILFMTSSLFGQVSNVKLDNDVYTFLSNMSQKGIIDYNDLVKPLSRRYIAERLIQTKNKISKLTTLQREELNYYMSEYGYEVEKINSKLKIKNVKVKSEKENLELGIKNSELEKSDAKNSELRTQNSEQESSIKNNNVDENGKQRDLFDKSWEFEVRNKNEDEKLIESVNEKYLEKGSDNYKNDEFNFVKKDDFNRWRFFNYNSNLMNLNVAPIMGYESANWEKSNYQNIFLGLGFNGEIGNVLGFNFELKQTRESPRVRNFLYNRFSNKTEIDLQLADAKRLEYSTINVDIGASWDWGSFTIGKNHLNWGYAESGKIILSEKAPSFPYLRLAIQPTEWLSFNYMHAWLNSEVIDTSALYSSWRIRNSNNKNRISYIQKFMALHSVTFSFWNGLDLSLGESVVYADDLQIAYLIPIMFFDLVDEYLNRNDNYAGGSTQLFLSASSRNHIPNTHLFASFHADELTPEGLFDPKTQYYKFAFTFGVSTIDMPIENLGLRLEYTKVYPGNYRHFIPTLTYESSSSLLGHWIGDNGDLFYASLDYTVFRGLKLKFWTQYIRKSTEALGNRAYKIQIPQPGFLFTDNILDRKNYAYYGFDVDYEIIHDAWLKFHYQYIDYEQQIENDKFTSTLFRDISFSFGYGI